ncbi:ferritin-like domain-containing protein [Hymenobacter oligotrophus]|uniref:Ferritin-like domain-containing protein n=1 Tax=Hymenobacter oligotrophus TaxID=2319843 RepID=A0A3B7QX16_9BACT|nr:ferritin-like domain-containing protein [Hymenobacter oligotrophus]AYA36085.1 ferritin-like domain-containing protein [Hymenobacter oligotrophus]
MLKSKPLPVPDEHVPANLQAPVERRTFLRYGSAALALTGLALAGCAKDPADDLELNAVTSQDEGTNALVDVGTGDFGVLNYAYALEQLESAFYAQVLAGSYHLRASAAENYALYDIHEHELVHRDFFKAAIAALGGTPIPNLAPDFSGIDFDSRTSVLTAARTFEDLGVAAYNGAGPLLRSPELLAIAGKIVSVEARHAALIRDIIQDGTFVGPDVVDLRTGLNQSLRPAQVVAQANRFLQPGSKLNVSGLSRG